MIVSLEEESLGLFRDIVCVDVETTGVLPEHNEVIEIGAVRIRDGVVVERFQTYVKPKRRVPPFIFKLTGISPDTLKTAPAFEEISSACRDFIGESVFLAHNAKFDFDTLNAEWLRMGVAPLQNLILDSRDLALILRPEMSSHKLHKLAEGYNVDFPNRHRAIGDAECLASIFVKMTTECKALPPLLLRESQRLLGSEHSVLRQFLSAFFDPSNTQFSLDYRDYLSSTRKQHNYKKSESLPWKNAANIPQFFESITGQLEQRNTQVRVAEFVANSLFSEKVSIIEAPTGTGKSLGYLVPALIYARQNQTPVIVSTKTKVLQTQLATFEIPRLSKLMKTDIHAVVVKGRENYVDIRRFDGLYQRVRAGAMKTNSVAFLALFHWLLKTPTGDLSELHPNIQNRFQNQLSYPRDAEANKDSACFVNTMRRQVKDADIVITNHALVFADLTHQSGILPESVPIIFDEAHTIADVATQSLSVQFTDKEIDDVCNQVNRQLVTEDSKKLAYFATDFVGSCDELLRQNTSVPSRYQQQVIDDGVMLSHGYQRFTKAAADLSQALSVAQSQLPDSPEGIALRETTISLLHRLTFFRSFEPNYVQWVEASTSRKRRHISLISAPVSLDDAFSDQLFAKRSRVIAISATLQVGGSFDFFLDHSGFRAAGPSIQTLALESDFNFSRQAIFSHISNLPEFSKEDSHVLKVSHTVAEIVRRFNGHSLILLTSEQAQRELLQALKIGLANTPISIHWQNAEISREVILDRFKDDPGVLMGLDSFWEGVDIPGNKVRAVVIPKLPFPAPGNPLDQARIKALETHGKNGFMDYLLPLAVIKFRQGIGRLIRSKQDRGMIFVLDSRLFSKNYGNLFLREIQHFKQLSGPLDTLLDDCLAWYDDPAFTKVSLKPVS